MGRMHIPLISDGCLLLSGATGDWQPRIVVGSDAWYAWLADEQNRSFSFRTPLVTITVRRERQRNGWYWYAYGKHRGKLRKAYLGKTEELTLERLKVVTATLHAIEPGQHNLPAQLTPLIGREQEVEAACALLRRPQVHLLTLTGTGGIGKTRLALQLATALIAEFPDGVCFVPLASISDPDLVIPTIAQTLGQKETGDWGPGQARLLQHLQWSLREKRLLLLIDNFEQVAAAAPQLSELVAACPYLKILVTSRAVLHIRGEHEFPVAPLALPDPKRSVDREALSQYAAVALFLQRAQAVKPDFQITAANASTIAEICIRLDGLPLAIELAAARVKLLPPQALLARLEHRLQILTSASQDVPPRQQTLRSTLTWSYDLLSAQEQRLFRRLCVFVGGCILEAAETICNDLGVSVLDGVASLIDKSLLSQTEQTDHEPRLVMLETIREYGLECLNTSGEDVITQRAHAAYYLALAEQAAPELQGLQQAAWLERLEREHDNLRAALGWFMEQAEDEMALRLSGALWRFWWVRGQVNEGRNVLEQALAVSEGCKASVRAKALSAAGTLTGLQGNFEQAEALCRDGLALSRELEDPDGIVTSLRMLGYVAMEQSNYAAARTLLEEALDLSRHVDNTWGIAYSLEILAAVAFEQGEYVRAQTLIDESLAISRKVGDTWGIARSLWLLALVVLFQGTLTRAHAIIEEHLTLSREVNDQRGIAYSLLILGYIAFFQGQNDTMRTLFEESQALHKQTGDRRGIAWTLYGLGWVALAQGDYSTARTQYELCLSILRELDHKWFIALGLEGLACLASAQGQPAWAAHLWGAAEMMREAIDASISPVVLARYENFRAAARTQLGEETFAATWAEGRTMPIETLLHPSDIAPSPPETRVTQSTTIAKLPVTYPAGLTIREVEVLRWVAMGLTDIQVADKLILSSRTVSTHLRSIYNKLGVTSRSAATRFAVEHHLV